MDTSNTTSRFNLDEHPLNFGGARLEPPGNRENLEMLAVQLVDEVQRVKSEMLGVMAAVNALKALVVELASAVPPEALERVRATYAVAHEGSDSGE